MVGFLAFIRALGAEQVLAEAMPTTKAGRSTNSLIRLSDHVISVSQGQRFRQRRQVSVRVADRILGVLANAVPLPGRVVGGDEASAQATAAEVKAATGLGTYQVCVCHTESVDVVS